VQVSKCYPSIHGESIVILKTKSDAQKSYKYSKAAAHVAVRPSVLDTVKLNTLGSRKKIQPSWSRTECGPD